MLKLCKHSRFDYTFLSYICQELGVDFPKVQQSSDKMGIRYSNENDTTSSQYNLLEL